MRSLLLLFPLVVCALASSAATLDFDALADSELLTNQFSLMGVVFEDTVVLAAGVSLNEFEFPPKSNLNVISDFGAPISIRFAAPQPAVSAFFTYLEPITLAAFDVGDNLLGSVSSTIGCASNAALSGTPGCLPNEEISLSGIGAISRVTVTGNSLGGSFVLDNLNFNATSSPGSQIPEPATLSLALVGLAFIVQFARNKRL